MFYKYFHTTSLFIWRLHDTESWRSCHCSPVWFSRSWKMDERAVTVAGGFGCSCAFLKQSLLQASRKRCSGHPLPHGGDTLTSWCWCLLFAHLLNVGLSRLFPRFSVLCPLPGDLTVIIQRSLSLSVSWLVFFTDFALDHVFVYHLSASYSVSSAPCSQHLAESFTHKVLSKCIQSGHLICEK